MRIISYIVYSVNISNVKCINCHKENHKELQDQKGEGI